MGLLRQQNVWQCDHCKKEGVWGKDWRSKLVLHKSGGPGPWDEELVACSQECQDAIDQKRRWKKLPDKSKGEPAVEIYGGQLQSAHNASLSGRGDEPNYEVKPAGPRSA